MNKDPGVKDLTINEIEQIITEHPEYTVEDVLNERESLDITQDTNEE